MDTATLVARLPARSEAIARELAARVEVGLTEIGTRWPDAPELGDAFVTYLAERITQQANQASAMPRLRVDDLFLAWWAGTGDPRGIAAFEAAHAGDLRRLVGRFDQLPPDDLRQQLRMKLFVGTETKPPRIREYSGFGFLQNWVRVTAARSFVDAARADRTRRYAEDLDETELGPPPVAGDPRDAHQRAQLSVAIKRAFAAAVTGLSPRERTFLRHHSIDRLSLEQISQTYHVHRATVARILATARERLLTMTQAGVVAELGIASEELASAIRVLDTQLELSLSRVLR